MINENNIKDMLIGRTKDEALSFCRTTGIKCHISREDDINFTTTYDFNFNRINITVDSGIVTNLNVG